MSKKEYKKILYKNIKGLQNALKNCLPQYKSEINEKIKYYQNELYFL